jgi:hypothetical protein
MSIKVMSLSLVANITGMLINTNSKTVDDFESKIIAIIFKKIRMLILLLGLNSDCTKKIKDIKNKKIPKKVGSGAKLVTPLPESPDPLEITILETKSGI